MDQQLMAGIAATLTLGTAILGSTCSLLKSLERMERRIIGAILGLGAELKERDGVLREEIEQRGKRLENTISGFRASGLRDEVTAVFNERRRAD